MKIGVALLSSPSPYIRAAAGYGEVLRDLNRSFQKKYLYDIFNFETDKKVTFFYIFMLFNCYFDKCLLAFYISKLMRLY
jgi:hypothetical protein